MTEPRQQTATSAADPAADTTPTPPADRGPARGGKDTRWERLRPVLGRLALAAASGAVLFLAFAPRPLWWLAPVAFAGFGLALHGRRLWGSAGYGLVFGLTFNLLHLLWIDDFLGAEFGPGPWLALSGVMALYIAVAAALMSPAGRLPGAPVWLALVFLLQEYARSRWPANGFPWGRIGFSQPEGAYTPLAAIGGAPLVGFAVLTSGFGLARLIVHLRRSGATPWTGLARAAAYALVPLLAGLVLWPAVGTDAQAGSRTVAVVQGNAPNAGIGLLGERDTIRAGALAESERLATRIDRGDVPRPDLVVWPETTVDVVGGRDPDVTAAVDELGAPTLVGSLYRTDDGRTDNAVVAWRPGEGPGERYTKQELVPFSEYVPMREIAAWFTPFVGNTRDMRWGREPGVFDIAGTRVGTAICYEAAYDYPSRDAVNAGARMIVLPTNNAWFGDGEMTYQQLAMARLRAVEHGRAVVVAATSGVSAVVRPDGTVAQQTGMYTADSLVADVPLRETTTLADRFGPWTERVMLGAALCAVLAGFVLRRRAVHTTGRGG
ncbi:apolipoprotein N-acyltransferase [Prauserella alba]|uniref:apolipoprotein N-acyltransferase n=1 Tax=Prauserella alba TaxID=176898 RepID=UPI0035589012|nr:apolipoprotein N-acyltransferase [Prauserella alba]